ncbi:hypothetical protein [Streptomyces sp. NPDC046985]
MTAPLEAHAQLGAQAKTSNALGAARAALDRLPGDDWTGRVQERFG